MARNISSLKEKMAAHEVAQSSPNGWSVKSATSDKFYAVSRNRDGIFQCGCRSQTYTKRGESCSCSHVASVLKFIAEADARKITLHDGVDAAKRTHRPMIEIGNGLFATTRVS